MNTESEYAKKAKAFLTTNTVAVLSTVSPEGKPHAAVIYATVDDDLNFFFLTKSDTAKSKNLEKDGNASLTVVDPKTLVTVQVQGIVHDIEEDSNYASIYLKTVEASGANRLSPPLYKLKGSEKIILYKLTPTWLRYADFSEKTDTTETGKDVFHRIIPQQ